VDITPAGDTVLLFNDLTFPADNRGIVQWRDADGAKLGADVRVAWAPKPKEPAGNFFRVLVGGFAVGDDKVVVCTRTKHSKSSQALGMITLADRKTGDLLKTYHGYSGTVYDCARLPDGDIAFAGYNNGYAYRRLSPALAPRAKSWSRLSVPAGAKGISYTRIAGLGDGTVVLAGYIDTTNPAAPAYNRSFVRLSYSGSTIAQPIIDPTRRAWFTAAAQRGTGLLFAGTESQLKQTSTARYELTATDLDGSVLWRKQGPFGGPLTLRSIRASNNGTFGLLSLDTSSAKAAAHLMRIDATGRTLWARQYALADATVQFHSPDQLVAHVDGGFTVGGTRKYSGGQSGFLIRTDAWGNATCSGAGKCFTIAEKSCDDANTCTLDRCDPAKGCVKQSAPLKTPCNDGDLCKTGDQCAQGTCIGGTAAADCDDDNACTADSCQAKLGCQHAANGAMNGKACDDDKPCTSPGTCEKGVCKGRTSHPRFIKPLNVGGWSASRAIAAAPDGGALIAGSWTGYAPLVKVTADGVVQWYSRVLPKADRVQHTEGLTALGEDSIAILVYSAAGGSNDLNTLLWLDADGNPVRTMLLYVAAGRRFYRATTLARVPGTTDVVVAGWGKAAVGGADLSTAFVRYSKAGKLVSQGEWPDTSVGGYYGPNLRVFAQADGTYLLTGQFVRSYSDKVKLGQGRLLTGAFGPSWLAEGPKWSTIDAVAGQGNASVLFFGRGNGGTLALFRRDKTGVLFVKQLKPSAGDWHSREAFSVRGAGALHVGDYSPTSGNKQVFVAYASRTTPARSVRTHGLPGANLSVATRQPAIAMSDGGLMILATHDKSGVITPALLRTGPHGYVDCKKAGKCAFTSCDDAKACTMDLCDAAAGCNQDPATCSP